ncbi:MAG: DinB family protein [Calditrichia bacterium]
MPFKLQDSINIISRTPAVLEALLSDLPEAWLRSNEGKDTWSPYDIVGHLIHGEKTDWVVRTKIILANSGNKQFESFDRFAQEKEDNSRSIEILLAEFRELRAQNIQEFKSLQISEIDLRKKGIHPELGEVSLQQLLATWVVHDLGHIAQISRVMAKQYGSEVGPWMEYIGVLKR